jgi:hypothetical protein
MLAWVSKNRRKKISSIDRVKQIQYLFYYISTSDLDERFRALRKIKMDKFYVRKLVQLFIQNSENYQDLYLKYLNNNIDLDDMVKMSEIESRLETSRTHLYPLLKNLISYLKLYSEMTDLVISKYYKFLFSLVKKRVHATSRYFDEEELYQNYIGAALKALDRYDPKKGALTSYIQLWIKNNMQSAEENPEYGIAYEIPALRLKQSLDDDTKKDENFSISLDSLCDDQNTEASAVTSLMYSFTDDLEEDTKRQTLWHLAKIADPTGIARLSLGIMEYVDSSMKQQMKASMTASFT